MGEGVTAITDNPIVAMPAYVLFLAIPLYRVARRPST
jgi:hypothetical protein